MNSSINLNGLELIDFLKSIGCNIRNHSKQHYVLWSVYTGTFFVVPSCTCVYLDNLTLQYILFQCGLSYESFINMYNHYKI